MIRDNRMATRKDKSALLSELNAAMKVTKNEEIKGMYVYLKERMSMSRGVAKNVAECDMEIHQLLQRMSEYQQQDLVETCRLAAGQIESLITKRDEVSYELQGQSGGLLRKLFGGAEDKGEKEKKEKQKQYFDYRLQLSAQQEKQQRFAQQHDDARREAVELLREEQLKGKLTSAQAQKKNMLMQTITALQNKMSVAAQLVARIATQIEQYEKMMTAEELGEVLSMIADNPLADIKHAEEVVLKVEEYTEIADDNANNVADILGELNFAAPQQNQQETDLERELMMEANIANAQAEIEKEDAAQKAAAEEAAKAEYDRIIAQEVARRLAQAQAEAAENAQRAQDEASVQLDNATRDLQEE